MGVSGSGKSTLAEALAKYYGYTYLDADEFHSAESRALMASGTPLTDTHRAPWVASLKQRLELCARQHIPVVLAFSGLKKKHRSELRSAGLRTIFLFLKGDKQVIQERINNREGHFMPPQLLGSQFDSLEEPEHESDVYAIDVWPTLQQVIAQATAIVAHTLLSTERSCQS